MRVNCYKQENEYIQKINMTENLKQFMKEILKMLKNIKKT